MIAIHIETKRELVSKDGKRFQLSSDIAFSIKNKETGNLDKVICRIIGMTESDYEKDNGYIFADNVEINGCESNPCMFYLRDMIDVKYVYYD